MFEHLPEPERPKLEPEVPSAQEIEDDIRNIVERYDGEELVQKLVDYAQLSLVGLLTTMQSHGRLQSLPRGVSELIQTIQGSAAPDEQSSIPAEIDKAGQNPGQNSVD